VTLEGRSNWGDHGGPFPNGDDDYTFGFHSPSDDPLSVNGRHGLHVEFDSDETIDNFKSEAWNDLHNSVNAADAAKALLSGCAGRQCTQGTIDQLNAAVKAPAQFFDGDTSVLTGMFGLDGEHDLKAELHPLFAFASQLNSHSDPLDEVWLMFARNRGDEGFCSGRLWESGLEDHIVHLRWRPGATGVEVNWSKTQFEGTPGTSGPDFMVVPPGSQDEPGVYAIFHLGPAENGPFIDGSVHLIWSGLPPPTGHGNVIATTGQFKNVPAKTTTVEPSSPKNTKTKAASAKPSTPAVKTAALDEPGAIEATLASTARQLTDAQLKSVVAARPPVAKPTVHELPPGRVQTASALPVTVRTMSVVTYNAGPATEKVARDKANIKALCAVTHNAPPGLPAEACKPPAHKP